MRRILFIAAIGAIAVAVFLTARATKPASGNPEPWPPFVMRYRVLANEQPDGADSAYQTWDLDYESSRSWKQTLVSDDVYAARIGSWASFDGVTYRSFNALSNVTNEFPAEEDALATPGQWLVPKSRSDHQAKGFSLISGGELSRTETLSCVDEPGCVNGSIVLHTEMTVDDSGVPQKVVEAVGDGGPQLVFEVIDMKAGG